MMKRTTFATVASVIALAVGSMALLFPAVLLESKGIVRNAAAEVWVREVGVLLLVAGALLFHVRSHADTPTLKALYLGNLALQLGLLAIEPVAWWHGTIPSLVGIVPNTLVHLLLAAGFAHHAARINGRP
jgi:hypothetical protein